MRSSLLRFPLAGLLLLSSACMVGPNYKNVPPRRRRRPTKSRRRKAGKKRSPTTARLKASGGRLYNDPQLNALEEQVSISNQNVLAAEANFRAARYAIAIARAGLYPTVSVGPTIGVGRSSGGTCDRPAPRPPRRFLSCPRPLPGRRISGAACAVACRPARTLLSPTSRLLENARLSYQSELAQDYFELHGTDGDIDLLDRTAKSYEDYLKLTQRPLQLRRSLPAAMWRWRRPSWTPPGRS